MKNESTEVKVKKPFYKKWWFWVLVIFFVPGIIGSFGDDNENNLETTSVETTSEEAKTTPVEAASEETETTPVETSEETEATLTETSEEVKTEDVEETEIQETSYDTDTSSSGTMGQRNALGKAGDYLDYSAFSYTGLIEQLKFEGFSDEEATYAADNCGADWNEQAAKKAQDYIEYSSFSRSGLIEQLEFEGFTSDQAEYGATAVGY